MTVINHKSISGITSITAPAGSDDLLTVHTNDTTERFRILKSGAIVTGVATASNFKTGTTNVHSAGVEAAAINVLGADTPIGTGATIYDAGGAVFTGVVTATSFKGSITDATGYTTINNNANNRLITGSATANTLEAESSLTFDGTTINNENSGGAANLVLKTTTNSFNSLILDSNRAANTQFAIIDGRWNGNVVNRIQFVTGSDGTNKDDGYMAFHTRTSGANLTERLRIDSSGNVGVNNTSPTQARFVVQQDSGNTAALIKANNGASLALGGVSQPRILLEAATSASDFIVYTAGGSSWGSPSWAERLRITSGGAINIGQGNESSAVENLVELYVGGANGSHATIRGKYNRTNEFNRSEVRFGVQDNSAGKGFLAFATGTNSASERLRIRPTGQVEFKNGTFSDNVNCVMASGSTLEIGATATIKLRTATNERLQIDSTGNVHVGFSGNSLYFQNGFNNSNARIQNAGATNNSNLRFLTRNAGTEAERLRIENDGKLILKNNNGMMIDIQSSAGTGSAWIEFSDTDGTRKGYFGYGSSSSEKVYWVQQKAANMSMYSNGYDRFEVQSDGQKIVKNGRLNINSTFIDFSGSISTPSTAAAIFRPADNTLAFSTANEERLRIDNNGNVLIKGSTFYGSGTGGLQVHDAQVVLSKPSGSNTRNWRIINNNTVAGNLGIQMSTASGGTTYATVMDFTKEGRAHFGPNATDIQLIPHSTNSGHGQLYFRGNASNESSSIKLNHYGHADYVIGAGRHSNGMFSITRSDTGTDGLLMNSSGTIKIGGAPETLTGNGVSAKLQVNTVSNDYDGIMLGGGYNRSTINTGATYDLVLTSNAYPANATSKGIRFKCGTNGGGGPHEKYRIHSDGMLESRQHGAGKTYWFSSGMSGGYSTCTIEIDAHAYHSFVIDVAFGGYAGKWGTARYLGYENGSIYYPNEGTETTDSNGRNITHSSISGHKHRIYMEGGIGTHPVVQLQITISGPDAYIDTGDVVYTWA